MLNIFLAPATAVMSRLRFGLKLGLIGLLFLTPLTALVVYVYAKLNAEIQVSELERLGARQIAAARPFVEEIINHRGVAIAALNGDQAARAQLPAEDRKVDERLAVMTSLDSTIGVTLNNREQFSTISKRWLDLKSNQARLSFGELFAEHNKILDGAYQYMRLTADKSSMTLDFDMDLFYLMNVTVFKISYHICKRRPSA